jgi:hypothetical protein
VSGSVSIDGPADGDQRGSGLRDAASRGAVAVLDHGFWQRTFGGDPNVIGRTVTLGGEPYMIVGVLARGAAGSRFVCASPLRRGVQRDDGGAPSW